MDVNSGKMQIIVSLVHITKALNSIDLMVPETYINGGVFVEDKSHENVNFLSKIICIFKQFTRITMRHAIMSTMSYFDPKLFRP